MSVRIGAIIFHGILLESSNSLAIDTECNATAKGIQVAGGALTGRRFPILACPPALTAFYLSPERTCPPGNKTSNWTTASPHGQISAEGGLPTRGGGVTGRGLGHRRLAFDKALVCWYSCANAYVRLLHAQAGLFFFDPARRSPYAVRGGHAWDYQANYP